MLKDREGREYESPARVIAEPVAGNDVVLTLDVELQEIAQRALDDAIDNMEADGGDVVMLDPATGEILAVASRRADGTMRPSAFTETFEPGSLAKIFAAAALITFDRIRPGERVSGEGGTYRMPGRPSPLTDEHPLPSLTLADAIRVSSNIALAKFSARLHPDEQYGVLRGFGFDVNAQSIRVAFYQYQSAQAETKLSEISSIVSADASRMSAPLYCANAFNFEFQKFAKMWR